MTHLIQVRPQSQTPAIFQFGANDSPSDETIFSDTQSLLLNGRRWLPVMGEIHYARVDPQEWELSLRKMRAGGIDIVATYVFWIHHEEIESEFDWSGCRNLRAFIETCANVGHKVMVRIGPWCHGEVRNGGLPDWILSKPFKSRTNDEQYLSFVRRWFSQIAEQLRGQLWKDGGPIVGVQIENEYGGPGEHLMMLKQIAREVGIDVPLYTRTGWPSTSTPLPFGELFPLFGAYPEGFWSRELTAMPGNFWRAFCFERTRTDVEIGMDQLGVRQARDEADAPQYPFLTCELGGGMEQSYHRRLRIDPMDVLAVAICKLGSGGNLPGYYMYHGGTNPAGKLTTLHESQATKYWNDVPVKSYDFQAPLGQFGQVNPHFHLLRRLHMFCRDFGEQLAAMPPYFAEQSPRDKSDVDTLRFAVRSDGNGGFVFINNYQRGSHMPGKRAQIHVDLLRESLDFPEVEIPANSACIWPFNLELGGVLLKDATAQMLCKLSRCDRDIFVFFADGDAAFAFDAATLSAVPAGAKHTDNRIVAQLSSSSAQSLRIKSLGGREIEILLLNLAQSVDAYKLRRGGADVLILSDAVVLESANGIELLAERPSTSVHVWPDDAAGIFKHADCTRSGGFALFEFKAPPVAVSVKTTPLRAPGAAREVKIGFQHVAEAPTDQDFQKAGEWNLRVTGEADHAARVRLRIKYRGDVARLYREETLLTDHFNHGRAFEFEFTMRAGRFEEQFRLQILPLSADAPIYFSHGNPVKGNENQACELQSIEAIVLFKVDAEFV